VNDVRFLLTGHFYNSLPHNFGCINAAQAVDQLLVKSREADMTAALQDDVAESISRSESISPASVSVLAAGERHAPIARLSPSKRYALVACFNGGGLTKKDGAWHGASGGKPVSGITTADLARDGMLTVTTKHRNGSARLTELGNWFARTLLCDATGAN